MKVLRRSRGVFVRPGFMRLSMVGFAVASLASCTHLPEDGPDSFAISSQASSTLEAASDQPVFKYVIVDITQNVIRHAPKLGTSSFAKTFGIRHSHPPDFKVSIGDSILVTIFEASAGGLFAPADVGAKSGNVLTLPVQMVDSTGKITVPFAGEVTAAGLTLQQIRRKIESKLAERALEPQVIVSLPEQGSATVTIVGEAIGGANTVKLKPAAERIAEIIGRTGGIKYPAYETHISLERKGKMATANFSSIVTNPSENIYVEPGDILYVWRYQPRFSVFGAVASTSQTQGLTGEFNFGNEGLMLHEALAKTGGLTDDRANANEIYVYRIEGRDALEAMGVDLCQFAPDTQKIPTIYRVNLRDPSGFFVMRMFPMRDKDIIYIANARAVEVTKFLRYIELMTNAATVISADMNATKINIRELGN